MPSSPSLLAYTLPMPRRLRTLESNPSAGWGDVPPCIFRSRSVVAAASTPSASSVVATGARERGFVDRGRLGRLRGTVTVKNCLLLPSLILHVMLDLDFLSVMLVCFESAAFFIPLCVFPFFFFFLFSFLQFQSDWNFNFFFVCLFVCLFVLFVCLFVLFVVCCIFCFFILFLLFLFLFVLVVQYISLAPWRGSESCGGECTVIVGADRCIFFSVTLKNVGRLKGPTLTLSSVCLSVVSRLVLCTAPPTQC
jgi:hypothetical protein